MKKKTKSEKKDTLREVEKSSKGALKKPNKPSKKIKSLTAKQESSLDVSMIPDQKVGVTVASKKNKKDKIPKTKNALKKNNSSTSLQLNDKPPSKEVCTKKEVSTEPTVLSEAVLAKIAKKKAKKLAKKLKKKELKSKIGEQRRKGEIKLSTTNIPTDPSNPEEELKQHEKKTKKSQKKLAKQLNGEQKEARSREPTIEGATIFVGNLPTNTKSVQLIKHFKDFAPITKIRFRTAGGKVLYKHKVRKEAGTLNAYMQLKNSETAERALTLNGSEFKSNHLRVTLANEKQNKNNSKCMIFVGNLKYSANEEKLRDIFSSCGEIEYVRCIRDGEKGCKGVAYVCFKAPEGVGLALELNETILDDRPIHVERYSEKKLGANDARKKSAVSEEKTKTGAAKRLEKKKRNVGNKQKSTADGDGNSKKNKKSEYRGVKVGAGMKKKQKKKKITSQMEALAKKIAPKIK